MRREEKFIALLFRKLLLQVEFGRKDNHTPCLAVPLGAR
jgi:hypothetical protein